MNPSSIAAASMMHGWLPSVVQALAITTALVSVAGRPRRWCAKWLAAASVLGALAAWAAHWYMNHLGVAGEPAPWQLWWWTGLCAASVAVVVAGWPRSRWFRRNLTVLAASLCLLSAGLTINGWIGYFPTVWTAWNQLGGGPLPGETDRAAVAAMQAAAATPPNGVLVEVEISASASHFPHRHEWVYLPPAWFSSNPPPPLPAVMMIGGEFHTPADWVRAGRAVTTLDDFAARHAGRAPVAVFVDSGGSFGNDTECVNGPRGNAADHLTKDVVPSLITEFGVSARQANWGVVGFSSGGTCAIDLAVMHPELFRAFVDIAGDRGPNAGTKQQTIDRLFGGDERAWASYDPASVINAHETYRNVSGTIVAPSSSARPFSPDDDELCSLGRSHGLDCGVVMRQGRHDWPFAADAFAALLPWLAGRLSSIPKT